MGTWADSFLPAITGDLAQMGPQAIQGQFQGQNAARQLALLDAQIKQQQIQNQQLQQPKTPAFHNLGGGAYAIENLQDPNNPKVYRPPQTPTYHPPVLGQPGQPFFDPSRNIWGNVPGNAPQEKPLNPTDVVVSKFMRGEKLTPNEQAIYNIWQQTQRGQQQDIPKLRPGERWNPQTQTASAVPGSDLFITQSGKHSKDFNALKTMGTTTDQALDKIDYILSDKNKDAFNSNFGGYNALVTSRYPGAQNMRNEIESLKSNLKMAGLEMIRGGGSIGQMTEREWPIVESMIARIDPTLSEDQARGELQKIRAYLERIRNTSKDVYETEWNQTQYFKPVGGKSQPQQPNPMPSPGMAKPSAQGWSIKKKG